MIDIGCSDLLEELPATPRVWKAVLENYPGLETMTRLSADPQQEEEREASIATSHYLRVSDVMPPSDSTPKAVPQVIGSRVDTQRTDHEALDEAMVNAFTRFYPQGAPPDLFNMGGGDQSVASSVSGVSRQTDPLHGWQNAFGNAGGQTGQDFSAPIWRLERSLAGLRTSVTHRIMGQDAALDLAFGGFYKDMMNRVSEVNELGEMARSEAQKAMEKLQEYEQELEKVICPTVRRGTIPGPHLSVSTMERSSTPPPTLKWSTLPPESQQELLAEIIDHLDIERLAGMVGSCLGVTGMKEDIGCVETRVLNVESELTSEQGVIAKMQDELKNLTARGNLASSERSGYVFSGPTDIQALVQLVGPGKLSVMCLDLHGLITLAQDPFVLRGRCSSSCQRSQGELQLGVGE